MPGGNCDKERFTEDRLTSSSRASFFAKGGRVMPTSISPCKNAASYLRVSSLDQNEVRQLEGLALNKTFSDKASGKDVKRPQLEAMLSFVRERFRLSQHPRRCGGQFVHRARLPEPFFPSRGKTADTEICSESQKQIAIHQSSVGRCEADQPGHADIVRIAVLHEFCREMRARWVPAAVRRFAAVRRETLCRFSFTCRKRAWRRTFIPLPVEIFL
jgi:hypothetical protein